MRKVFASAMLCLLLLLSVRTAQCNVRCSAAAMPRMSSSSSMDSMAMDEGMEHCDGMKASQAAVAEAACGGMTCRHAALPAAADSVAPLDHVASPMLAAADASGAKWKLPVRRVPFDAVEQPPLQRSPLDQSSLQRV